MSNQFGLSDDAFAALGTQAPAEAPVVETPQPVPVAPVPEPAAAVSEPAEGPPAAMELPPELDWASLTRSLWEAEAVRGVPSIAKLPRDKRPAITPTEAVEDFARRSGLEPADVQQAMGAYQYPITAALNEFEKRGRNAKDFTQRIKEQGGLRPVRSLEEATDAFGSEAVVIGETSVLGGYDEDKELLPGVEEEMGAVSKLLMDQLDKDLEAAELIDKYNDTTNNYANYIRARTSQLVERSRISPNEPSAYLKERERARKQARNEAVLLNTNGIFTGAMKLQLSDWLGDDKPLDEILAERNVSFKQGEYLNTLKSHVAAISSSMSPRVEVIGVDRMGKVIMRSEGMVEYGANFIDFGQAALVGALRDPVGALTGDAQMRGVSLRDNFVEAGQDFGQAVGGKPGSVIGAAAGFIPAMLTPDLTLGIGGGIAAAGKAGKKIGKALGIGRASDLVRAADQLDTIGSVYKAPASINSTAADTNTAEMLEKQLFKQFPEVGRALDRADAARMRDFKDNPKVPKTNPDGEILNLDTAWEPTYLDPTQEALKLKPWLHASARSLERDPAVPGLGSFNTPQSLFGFAAKEEALQKVLADAKNGDVVINPLTFEKGVDAHLKKWLQPIVNPTSPEEFQLLDAVTGQGAKALEEGAPSYAVIVEDAVKALGLKPVEDLAEMDAALAKVADEAIDARMAAQKAATSYLVTRSDIERLQDLARSPVYKVEDVATGSADADLAKQFDGMAALARSVGDAGTTLGEVNLGRHLEPLGFVAVEGHANKVYTHPKFPGAILKVKGGESELMAKYPDIMTGTADYGDFSVMEKVTPLSELDEAALTAVWARHVPELHPSKLMPIDETDTMGSMLMGTMTVPLMLRSATTLEDVEKAVVVFNQRFGQKSFDLDPFLDLHIDALKKLENNKLFGRIAAVARKEGLLPTDVFRLDKLGVNAAGELKILDAKTAEGAFEGAIAAKASRLMDGLPTPVVPQSVLDTVFGLKPLDESASAAVEAATKTARKRVLVKDAPAVPPTNEYLQLKRRAKAQRKLSSDATKKALKAKVALRELQATQAVARADAARNMAHLDMVDRVLKSVDAMVPSYKAKAAAEAINEAEAMLKAHRLNVVSRKLASLDLAGHLRTDAPVLVQHIGKNTTRAAVKGKGSEGSLLKEGFGRVVQPNETTTPSMVLDDAAKKLLQAGVRTFVDGAGKVQPLTAAGLNHAFFTDGHVKLLNPYKGVKEINNGNIRKLRALVEAERMLDAAAITPTIALKHPLETLPLDTTMDHLDNLLSVKKAEDVFFRKAIALAHGIMFGGRISETLEKLPSVMRPVQRTLARPIEQAVGDAANLLKQNGFKDFAAFLVGQPGLRFSGGKRVFSAGTDHLGTIGGAIERAIAKLDPEQQKLVNDAINLAFAGKIEEAAIDAETRDLFGDAISTLLGATARGSVDGANKVLIELTASLTDATARVVEAKAVMKSLKAQLAQQRKGLVGLKGAERVSAKKAIAALEDKVVASAVQVGAKVKAVKEAKEARHAGREAVAEAEKAGMGAEGTASSNFFRDLFAAVHGNRTGLTVGHRELQLLGLVIDAGKADPTPETVHKLAQRITKLYGNDDDAAVRAMMIMVAHSAAEHSRDQFLHIGGAITARQAAAYRKFLGGYKLEPEELPMAQEVVNRFGLSAHLVGKDHKDAQIFLPKATLKMHDDAVARGMDPNLAALRGVGNMNDVANDAVHSIARQYKVTLVRGLVMPKQRFFTMATYDLLGNTYRGAGIGPAINATIRALTLNVVTLPFVAHLVAAVDVAESVWRKKWGLEEVVSFQERFRDGLQNAGDTLAHWASHTRWKLEVNDVLNASDSKIIETPTGSYTAREVAEVLQAEGVLATFGTSELSSALAKDIFDVPLEMMKKNPDAMVPQLKKILPEYLHDIIDANPRDFVEALPRIVTDVAESFEERSRIGAVLALMEAGMNPRAAARAVVVMHYDYAGSVGKFDKHYIVSILFPFWAFQKNANRQFINMVTTPEGAYRIGVARRVQQGTADVVQAAIDTFNSDPYGVDTDQLSGGQKDTYYTLVEATERKYGNFANVPASAKAGIRLLMRGTTAGSVEVVDGERYVAPYMKEADKAARRIIADAMGGATSLTHRPGDMPRPEYLQGRAAIQVGLDLNDEEAQILRASQIDLAVTTIAMPEDATYAAARHMLSIAQSVNLLAQYTVGGIIAPESGSELVPLVDVVAQVFTPTKVPLMGSALHFAGAQGVNDAAYRKVSSVTANSLLAMSPGSVITFPPRKGRKHPVHVVPAHTYSNLELVPGWLDMDRLLRAIEVTEATALTAGRFTATAAKILGADVATSVPSTLARREQRKFLRPTDLPPQ